MTERDAFEARFHAAVRGYAGRVSSELDPVELAHRIATRAPRRHGFAATLPWSGVAVPRLAWVLLLAGVLLALVVGGLVAGVRRPDHAVVIAPTQTPAATTALDEGTDILATTKGRPLPAQATCPPGSEPDEPGPADQARPRRSFSFDHAMAFDRRAGRIVLFDPSSTPGTWTFDVCANSWQLMHPDREPPNTDPAPSVWLAYDADSDRTVALLGYQDGVGVWAYDLATDRWALGTSPPLGSPRSWGPGEIGLLYDPVSGLVVVRDAVDRNMWAYDVGADQWTTVRQGAAMPRAKRANDPPAGEWDRQVLGYDGSADRIILWVQGEPAWTFDPRAGRWGQDREGIVRLGPYDYSGTASAYDEAAALAVFMRGTGPDWADPRGVLGYDASLHAWEYLWNGSPCFGSEITYDAVNSRIVCLSNASPNPTDRRTDQPRGMVAFDVRARQWVTLLGPVDVDGEPVPTWVP
jgi:hypothetical protein